MSIFKAMTKRRKLLLSLSVACVSLMPALAISSVIDKPFFQSIGLVVVWGDTDFIQNPGFAPIVSDFILLNGASGSEGTDLIDGDVFVVRTGSLDPISNANTSGLRGQNANPITGQTSGGVYADNGNYFTSGVLSAEDTLTGFGLDATTDSAGGVAPVHNTSFFVASNTPFDIFVQSTNLVTTGDFADNGYDGRNINFAMSVNVNGADALQFLSPTLPYGNNAQDPSNGGEGIIDTVNDLADMATQVKVFDGGRKTALSVGSLAQQSVRFDNLYSFDTDVSAAGIQPYDFSDGIGTISADVTFTVFTP